MSDEDKIITGSSDTEEIKKLLQENLDYARANYALLKKASHFIVWQKVFTVLKLLLIIIPIVIGIIYLPPMIQQIYKSYAELLQ